MNRVRISCCNDCTRAYHHIIADVDIFHGAKRRTRNPNIVSYGNAFSSEHNIKQAWLNQAETVTIHFIKAFEKFPNFYPPIW